MTASPRASDCRNPIPSSRFASLAASEDEEVAGVAAPAGPAGRADGPEAGGAACGPGGGEGGFHLGDRLAEGGQAVVAQLGDRVPAGVAHHAHRTGRLTADRDRHRDQAGLDELVVLGPGLGGVEEGEAGGAAGGGQDVTDAEGHRHAPPPGELRDEPHPVPVPYGHRHRLVQLVGEPRGGTGDGVAQPRAGQIGLAQLHQPRREHHVTPVGPHVTEVRERAEHPVDGGPGQPGRPHEVRGAGGPPRVGGERAQHAQPAFEGSGRFHRLLLEGMKGTFDRPANPDTY
ncbi:hypothetical protein GCM10020001_077330 [Nonomuraea salmonea]